MNRIMELRSTVSNDKNEENQKGRIIIENQVSLNLPIV